MEPIFPEGETDAQKLDFCLTQANRAMNEAARTTDKAERAELIALSDKWMAAARALVQQADTRSEDS